MDNWFNSKWFVRVISLAFAILLYVFVNVEEAGTSQNENIIIPKGTEQETLEDVPVEIRIDSEKYVVSGVPETVTVSLEGPASFLAPTARQRNFDVFVDLKGLDAGEHTVEVEYENIPKELSVYIEPKTVDVVIEEKATKTFKVAVDFINMDQLPPGYELGDYEVSPDTVTITSSKSVIDQIGIVKVYVDVAGVTEPINRREVPVNVYDSQGNELRTGVDPESVVVSVDVKNPNKTVPLSVKTTGSLPDGFSLLSLKPNIDEIKIFATSDILAGIDKIETEAIDLASIDESGTIQVKLALPDGVAAPDVKQVEVAIELELERTIDDVPIDVENVADGQEVSILQPDSPVMDITVAGNEKDVASLKKDDFRLFIDVDGLAAGEHRVPITVEGPENVKVDTELRDVLIEIS